MSNPRTVCSQGEKENDMNRKVKVDKKIIDACFEVEHQADAMVNLYKLVFPDWNEIAKIDGFPRCDKDLCVYICRCFIAFDEKHHPNVIKGGLWLNNGFSSLGADDLDWEIDANDIPIRKIGETENDRRTAVR